MNFEGQLIFKKHKLLLCQNNKSIFLQTLHLICHLSIDISFQSIIKNCQQEIPNERD